MKRFGKLFALLTFFLLTSCGGTPYYRAAPIDAVVVDAETNMPIEGALVVANWQLVVGALDGYRNKGQLQVKETSTDKAGRFHFNGFTKLNPMFYDLRGLDPQVLIFKGGYEYERVNNSYGPISPGAYREAAVNGAVVRLKKLVPVTIGHKEGYHMSLAIHFNSIVEDCEWKQIPRMIRAMEAEAQRLKILAPNAYVGVLTIDEIESYKEKCGSAVEFFRSYKE